MKKLLPIIILFLFVYSVSAQDVITATDGNKIRGKVILISDDFIEYKIFDDQDDKSFFIKQEDVKQIKYENGDVAKFIKGNNNDIAPIVKTEIQRKFDAAYSLKKKGGIYFGTGISCAVIGSLFVTLGSIDDLWTTKHYYSYYGYINDYNAAGAIVITVIGGVMLGAAPFLITFGIIYLATANIRLNDLNFGVTLYQNSNTSLNMAYTGNGIGLKLKF